MAARDHSIRRSPCHIRRSNEDSISPARWERMDLFERSRCSAAYSKPLLRSPRSTSRTPSSNLLRNMVQTIRWWSHSNRSRLRKDSRSRRRHTSENRPYICDPLQIRRKRFDSRRSLRVQKVSTNRGQTCFGSFFSANEREKERLIDVCACVCV